MKLNKLTLILIFIGIQSGFAQIIYSDYSFTKFDSHALMLDISADNDHSKCTIDIEKGTVVSEVPMDKFIFDDPLMQQDFLNNYIQFEKYPTASLNADIINLEEINFKQQGVYTPILNGIMIINGEEQEVEIEGSLIVDDKNMIEATAEFTIELNLFNIIIPEYNKLNIAKKVKVSTEFKFYDLLYSSN